VTFTPADLPNSLSWVEVDFADQPVTPDTEYFIVMQPPSGATWSFGYGWGYAVGDVYADGSLWFTREFTPFWLDLPSLYDFAFRTYGLV